MEGRYRFLCSDEITQLTSQNCSSEDWGNVLVLEDFDVSRVQTVRFSGRVRLGTFEKNTELCRGLKRPTGIYNAHIHNCTIGNDVYIDSVGCYIANYHIEDRVVIQNAGMIATDRLSTFGNGVKTVIVNEAGGREIPIYDKLSSQQAYIAAFFRHRPQIANGIEQLVGKYLEQVKSETGWIGKDSRLINCGTIKNVRLGDGCTAHSVELLENGSVNSTSQDPVCLGPGVIARDFIIASGSKIKDSVILENCFVGQHCLIQKGFSAENSLFFANCQMFNGEACSVFAGPYTNSHHKSTLLIAGMFSFFNAGSGTNQSNHLYKSGPKHQGLMERGSKTGSDTYVLWPARIGAFTLVLGNHYTHSDTSQLPFSYLIGEGKKSRLIPAVNLCKTGTLRDSIKWKNRDKRKNEPLDIINYELLNPYTVFKMIKGQEILQSLKKSQPSQQDLYTYNNVRIRKDDLQKGIRLYQLGIDKFLGQCTVDWLLNPQNIYKTNHKATGQWADWAGMICPIGMVEDILNRIENKQFDEIEQLSRELQHQSKLYLTNQWTWVTDILKKYYDIDTDNESQLKELIEKYKQAIEEFYRLVREDVAREFGEDCMVSYGMDGDNQTVRQEYTEMWGDFQNNDFVRNLRKLENHEMQKANRAIDRI